nr:hypothetical protein [Pandoravirus massiliensis]
MLFEFFAVVGAVVSAAVVVVPTTLFCLVSTSPRRPRTQRSPSLVSTIPAMDLDNTPHHAAQPCGKPVIISFSEPHTETTTPVPVYPVEQSDSYVAERQQLAVDALGAAAAFGPGDMHAAKAIVEAALATQRGAPLDLYVVAGPCAGMPSTVVTLESMRQQWPRLFEHGDPGTAEGAKVWSLALLPDPVRFGRIAAHRVVLDRATLDVEFGPREDPLVARLRALVPTPPSM